MKFLLLLPFLLTSSFCVSQCLSDLNLQFEGEYQYPVFYSALTPVYDALDRPYLYVASNELGVKVFDVSGNQPVQVAVIDTVQLSQQAMSLTQLDSLLYVCVGSHFANSDDPAGLTVVNVADPTSPEIIGNWTNTGSGSGAGIVKVEDNIAYLGAMGEGVVLLDVSDPSNIQMINQFIPDYHFPVTNDSAKVNARGMEVINGLVYLCYDAGGFRILDCTNTSNIQEIGAYANPITYSPSNWPRAYNNVAIVHDTLAYVAVDYCGVEVLNISDPSNITLVEHWNPHGCPQGAWWDAPIHANEIVYKPECDLIFLSTGKSESYVLNVSDPYQLDSCDSYGTINDTTATWGICMSDDDIYLSYTYVSTAIPQILVPFYSTWSGIKKISYTYDCSLHVDEIKLPELMFPNPAESKVFFSEKVTSVSVYDMGGKQCMTADNVVNGLSISSLPGGLYFVELNVDGFRSVRKLVVSR